MGGSHDDEGPNVLVPRLPGTAVFAVIGGLLVLAMALVVVVRLARGEPLVPARTDDTDATETDLRSPR